MFGWLKKALKTGGATATEIKQSLSAEIIRACPECGAAGIDESGQEVGTRCPKCFAPRPLKEDLGIIWKKGKR
jgi:hypothetical protein